MFWAVDKAEGHYNGSWGVYTRSIDCTDLPDSSYLSCTHRDKGWQFTKCWWWYTVASTDALILQVWWEWPNAAFLISWPILLMYHNRFTVGAEGPACAGVRIWQHANCRNWKSYFEASVCVMSFLTTFATFWYLFNPLIETASSTLPISR